MRAENVTGPLAHHGEGPVWWEQANTLLWVDGDAGDLLALDASGVRRRHIDDEYLAFVRPRATGGLAAVGARTLHLSEEEDGDFRAVATLLDDPRVRMNDGCCDASGRLLTGSMAYDATLGAGVLRRIDSDLAQRDVLTDVTVSNGLGFSPFGGSAYYVDSITHRVDAFEVRDDELTARRTFVEIPAAQGMPDGLTVAADGSVWVALWGGSAVQGYDPTGALIARIELPVPQVSSCAFGGDDLSTLYITTSAQGLVPEHGTEAGSLYSVRPGVHGMPVASFAG